MKKLTMIVIAAALVLSAATRGWTADAAKNDKLEAAKIAEQKGDTERVNKDYAMAITYYRIALHTDRENAVLYDKLGIVELQMGSHRSARKYFTQAIKYDPHYVAAINNLGVIALLDKKYKTAVGYFKQALALDESFASTHLNLAEAWMGLNQTDRAMTEYARALELDADVLTSSNEGIHAQFSSPEQRARIMFLLAKSYLKRGNVDGALESLRRAKELHYPDLAKVYTDPDFAALWKDPRLATIVKK